MAQAPKIPLPPPLRGNIPGSFPHYTVTQRFASIVRRVLADTDWAPEARTRLEGLIAEIPDTPINPLPDDGAPDIQAWKAYLIPYLQMDWLHMPWFPLEMYFFRRILAAIGYFQRGANHGTDPYWPQKHQDLEPAASSLSPWHATLDSFAILKPDQILELLPNLLRAGVWANQADLSMWPSGSTINPEKPISDQLDTRLLDDDTVQTSHYLVGLQNSQARVAFFLDNVGPELAHDFLLADFILETRIAEQVQFYCKPYPTYVSDATIADVVEMLEYLSIQAEAPLQRLARRLKARLDDGSLHLVTDYFFVSPLNGWEMPGVLYKQLATFDLLISKGDANYRRWVGDYDWAPTTPLADILSYLPAPFVALRVLKSPVILAMQPGQPEEMQRQDPKWQSNGHWGIVQFTTTTPAQA